MNTNDIFNEINRLKFENFLWIIFIILSIANIAGDNNDIEFLRTNDKTFKDKSNHIFEITLFVTLLIYIYFFIRNYVAYKNAPEQVKRLYSIKLLGSSLLIAGVICLIYFQVKQTSFVGSPAL